MKQQQQGGGLGRNGPPSAHGKALVRVPKKEFRRLVHFTCMRSSWRVVVVVALLSLALKRSEEQRGRAEQN